MTTTQHPDSGKPRAHQSLRTHRDDSGAIQGRFREAFHRAVATVKFHLRAGRRDLPVRQVVGSAPLLDLLVDGQGEGVVGAKGPLKSEAQRGRHQGRYPGRHSYRYRAGILAVVLVAIGKTVTFSMHQGGDVTQSWHVGVPATGNC
jgi:hypothetical protein